MSNEENQALNEGPVTISIKTLLEAGAHYGHQTDRWNPKMLPYIYGERNRIHIINLDQTMTRWERARKVVLDKIAMGGSILFVGTKQQAREPIAREAMRCGAHYVTARWLGGTLSNFQTLKNSIDRMRKLEDLLKQAEQEDSKIQLKKKERVAISKQLAKLEANLGGLRSMRKPPEVVFLVDVVKESIAIAEARRLHIPVVALVDTNSDPRIVTHPIPSNDDATRTISLFTRAIADAVIEGRAIYDARMPKSQKGGDDSSVVVQEPVAAQQNGHAAEATQEMSAS